MEARILPTSGFHQEDYCTAWIKSLATSSTPVGTCFPGIPVTLFRGTLPGALDEERLTTIDSKKPRSYTSLNESLVPLPVRQPLACGVVMIGRSQRRDASTSWSKWSLAKLSVLKKHRGRLGGQSSNNGEGLAGELEGQRGGLTPGNEKEEPGVCWASHEDQRQDSCAASPPRLVHDLQHVGNWATNT